MTLQEMIEKGYPDSKTHKGFKALKGNIIYWYTEPNRMGGQYRCFAMDKTGYLISNRYMKWDAQIILVDKE